ncbi:MAG: DUF4012 domain-containing protein [Acidimicrobiales bacterium]
MSKRTSGRRRRRVWVGALVVVLLLVAWIALLAARTASAYRHDKQGLATLEQVRSNLTPNGITSEGSQQLLDQAQSEFDSATSDLSSPFFVPVTIVPVVGRQYRAVRALSAAAGTVSAVGASFLRQVHGVLDEPHGAGPQRVASLRELSAISASAEAQLAHVDTGPSQALVSPLAVKHDEFESQLDEARSRLTNAAAVSAAAASILQGPQTYVVLAANNAEMRSGSGAFLDVGVATTTDGSVTVNDLGPSGEAALPVGAVAVTGDLQRNWGWLHPSLDMRNLGLTPQFDVTAPLAARMWTTLTGQQVNGVIAIDVAGLRQLLEATGPVESDGQTVSADNVEQYLLHDQYEGLTDNSTGSTQRQDALGSLTSAVLRQLEGQSTDLRTLASAVTSAVEGRHLMVWSSDPVDQAAWEVSGVSGSLTPLSVGISVINLGGNKLDQYLPVTVGVSTAPSGPGTEVTLTTHITNGTPSGESQFIAGPFPGVDVSYGGYSGIVSANVPGAATDITMTGAGQLAVAGPDGPTSVVAAPLAIAQGASATVVVRFRMPGGHGSMTVFPSARIPEEQWTTDGRTFADSTPTSIDW